MGANEICEKAMEESVFQENVPGRWSSHDMWGSDRVGADDGKDVSGCAEEHERGPQDCDAGAAREQARHTHVPDDVRRMIMTERASQPQTGPKGVQADARMDKALDKAEREARQHQREAILTRMVEGHKVRDGTGGILSASAARARVDAGDVEEENDEEDDDDEEFMRSFREKRLQEMQQARLQLGAAHSPEFGSCIDVDNASLAEELDRPEHSRVVVVLHLYEPSVPTCTRLNRILDELAGSMPQVKFLRMPAADNGMAVDRVALPILSLYRGQESLGVLAAIAHELGTDFFTREQVEELLVLELEGK